MSKGFWSPPYPYIYYISTQICRLLTYLEETLKASQLLNSRKNKITFYLSHAPNTTGRPYREMLTYKPLTNNAVYEIELRKIFTK